MKTATEYLWFNTTKQREFINVTREVENVVANSGIKEGLVLVSAMHITAGDGLRSLPSQVIRVMAAVF